MPNYAPRHPQKWRGIIIDTSLSWYDMIRYLFNRSWVDTRWQHHTTHLQQTIHTIHREYNSGSAGRAPSLRVIPWHLLYNWGKSTEKTSVRVAQYKNNEQAQRTNKNNNKHRIRTEGHYFMWQLASTIHRDRCRVTAGGATLAAIPFCRESFSAPFDSMWCHYH